MNDIQTCTHTKDDGSPCQAIVLRGKNYCYFHRRYYESTTLPGDKNYQPPLLESNHSLILAATDLYRAFLARKMDRKEVTLALNLLRLAAKAIADIERAAREEKLVAARRQVMESTYPKVMDSTRPPDMEATRPRPAGPTSEPTPAADRAPKSRYYDPEGCLAHLTSGT